MCSHYRDEPVCNGGKAGSEEDEDMLDTNTPPVFTELLIRMIEELSDDVVSWSIAGDSFIIKQLPAFESFLPVYYSHGKFSSFARQLNYYGFRRAKRTPSPRLSSNYYGSVHDAGAAAAISREVTWDEFSHPMFRRGRRDLLAGINRRHKEATRLKPGKADVQELDMLNSLRSDVDALSGDLKTVNGKLESIMSLLSDVSGGQNQTAPGTTSHGGGGGGGGGDFGFQRGNFAGSAAASADVVHGGSAGFGGWVNGGGNSDGGIHRGDQDWGVDGAPPGYFMGPRVPMDHQQEGSGQYPVYSRSSQTPSTQRYPGGHYQVLHGEALPPLAEALAARTSESASTGPPHQQRSPHHQPR